MMNHTCCLVDDDGVLVISTVRQMEYWKDHDFDYDFPRELLEQIEHGRIVAWESGGEGEHSVTISSPSTPSSTQTEKTGPFLLRILDQDAFVIMPYSQFTYAADCAEGEVAKTNGLSYRFDLSAGNYYISILKTGDQTWDIDISLADGRPVFRCGDHLPEP
jgi:hypothetical protein